MKSALLVLLLVSCGASAGEVKTARETTYVGEPAAMFNELKAATAVNYTLAETDANSHAIRTAGRWFTPEGQVDTKANTNPSSVQDKSINLALLVGLVEVDARSFKVVIEPMVRRKNELSSELETLKPGDPTVPGWVRGKVDSLQVEIHHRLGAYVIPTAGPVSDRPFSHQPSGW